MGTAKIKEINTKKYITLEFAIHSLKLTHAVIYHDDEGAYQQITIGQ